MKLHHKFTEIEKLVDANIPVLLTGLKGTGKTTIAKQVADRLSIPFYSLSMTRQTTLSHILGFMTISGKYSPSMFRKAVEEGGLFLFDELDAADPNVLLCLNTIENGFVSFPTGIVECHKDFRLIATANPQDRHSEYTGRATLDAATLDRFDIVTIERDKILEKSLVDINTFKNIQLIREILVKHGIVKDISMRTSLRYQKRKSLNLLENFTKDIFGDYREAYENYLAESLKIPVYTSQSECTTIDELFKLVKDTYNE